MKKMKYKEIKDKYIELFLKEKLTDEEKTKKEYFKNLLIDIQNKKIKPIAKKEEEEEENNIEKEEKKEKQTYLNLSF